MSPDGTGSTDCFGSIGLPNMGGVVASIGARADGICAGFNRGFIVEAAGNFAPRGSAAAWFGQVVSRFVRRGRRPDR